MTDTPRQAEFRELVRSQLARCQRRADEFAGPTRLKALMGWAGRPNDLGGVYARIRREEIEAAGFEKNNRGFYQRPLVSIVKP